jgi:hypothetical protein
VRDFVGLGSSVRRCGEVGARGYFGRVVGVKTVRVAEDGFDFGFGGSG